MGEKVKVEATAVPGRKTWGGGLAGIAATILVAIAAQAGYPISLEMAMVIVVGAQTLAVWIIPPALRDVLRRLNDGVVEAAQKAPDIPVSPPSK